LKRLYAFLLASDPAQWTKDVTQIAKYSWRLRRVKWQNSRLTAQTYKGAAGAVPQPLDTSKYCSLCIWTARSCQFATELLRAGKPFSPPMPSLTRPNWIRFWLASCNSGEHDDERKCLCPRGWCNCVVLPVMLCTENGFRERNRIFLNS
jgi:hypothetical protein